MGDIKFSQKTIDEQRCSSGVTTHGDDVKNDVKCARGFIWTVSVLMLAIAFGAINLLQFNEIIALRRRVEFLEQNAFILDVSIHRNVESTTITDLYLFILAQKWPNRRIPTTSLFCYTTFISCVLRSSFTHTNI